MISKTVVAFILTIEKLENSDVTLTRSVMHQLLLMQHKQRKQNNYLYFIEIAKFTVLK